MTTDGRDDGYGGISLEEALEKLADAERLTAVLEARLLQYQSALEAIHAVARKSLES